MRSMLFAALLLFPLQDPDIDQLVRRLGDVDPKVRESAATSLWERIDEARTALQRGTLHPDPEVRSRAAMLVARHDRKLHYEELRTKQRPAKVPNPGGPGAVDGGRFSFERTLWAPEGEPLGTIFETRLDAALDGFFEWKVELSCQGKPLAFESCGLHSPGKIFVPGPPPPGDCVLSLKGLRRWYCDLAPLECKEPATGSSLRVPGFSLFLEWPDVVVLADEPLPETVLSGTLSAQLVGVALKSGRYVRRGGWKRGFQGVPNPLDEALEPAWCGCLESPARKAPARLDEFRVTLQGYQNTPLDDVDSITLNFRLPIEEPFELQSPPLR